MAQKKQQQIKKPAQTVNLFKLTPAQSAAKNGDAWNNQRDNQYQRNFQQANKLVNRLDAAKANNNKDKAEELRGKLQALKLKEKQQRSSPAGDKTEQKLQELQQDYIAQIGELSATQEANYAASAAFYQQQIDILKESQEQQASYYQKILDAQTEATALETARAEKEAAIANDTVARANFMSTVSNRNFLSRNVLNTKRRVGMQVGGVFNL